MTTGSWPELETEKWKHVRFMIMHVTMTGIYTGRFLHGDENN